jgi:hypothetical protein
MGQKMEKLLSDDIKNDRLNHFILESVMRLRDNNSFFKKNFIYLFDNKKMDSFKSDIVVVESQMENPYNMIFVSKDSFVNTLKDSTNPKRPVKSIVDSFLLNVAQNIQENKNIVKIPDKDFSTWLEQSGFKNSSDVNKKTSLKM